MLVAGLLLIGAVAHRDGLFARAGGALERTPGPPVVLFVVGALLVAAVTAVADLDRRGLAARRRVNVPSPRS